VLSAACFVDRGKTPQVREAGPVATDFVLDPVIQGVWNKNFTLKLDDDVALKGVGAEVAVQHP
jgi:hypothetical protein